MKTIIVVPEFHSVIDVITNSSTELFISNTGKSHEVIWEFLSDVNDLLELNDPSCGVGNIFTITEENIGEFIKDNYYYLDNMVSETPEEHWDFTRNYYIKKGWNPNEWRDNECTQEIRSSHSNEACDAYDKYIEEFVQKHMSEYKKKLIGKTILVGATDNSIPYEIFDILLKKLNAYHIHCG